MYGKYEELKDLVLLEQLKIQTQPLKLKVDSHL